MEQLYIIRERDTAALGLSIYKMGYTSRGINARMNNYPKGSEVLFVIAVANAKRIERIVLKVFREKFAQCKDRGSEYFEGDINAMRRCMFEICNSVDIGMSPVDRQKEIMKNGWDSYYSANRSAINDKLDALIKIIGKPYSTSFIHADKIADINAANDLLAHINLRIWKHFDILSIKVIK